MVAQIHEQQSDEMWGNSMMKVVAQQKT